MKKCIFCHKELQTDYEERKYCSMKCYWQYRSTKKKIKCKQCYKDFYVFPCDIKRGKEFCSKPCFNEYRKGKTYEEIYGVEEAKIQKQKRSKTKINDKNPQWRGDKVGNGSLHDWVKRRKKKPNKCEICNKIKRLDLANVSGEYKRDENDYMWVCRRCHMEKDGRLFKSPHKYNGQKFSKLGDINDNCKEDDG